MVLVPCADRVGYWGVNSPDSPCLTSPGRPRKIHIRWLDCRCVKRINWAGTPGIPRKSTFVSVHWSFFLLAYTKFDIALSCAVQKSAPHLGENGDCHDRLERTPGRLPPSKTSGGFSDHRNPQNRTDGSLCPLGAAIDKSAAGKHEADITPPRNCDNGAFGVGAGLVMLVPLLPLIRGLLGLSAPGFRLSTRKQRLPMSAGK